MSVTTCPECARAERNPATGYSRAGCRDCEARMLAHGQEFAYRRDGDGNFTPEYRAALASIAKPGESINDTARRVNDWARRIAEARGQLLQEAS